MSPLIFAILAIHNAASRLSDAYTHTYTRVCNTRNRRLTVEPCLYQQEACNSYRVKLVNVSRECRGLDAACCTCRHNRR
jgi:hypothetical protein